jgi:HrpA-like RNA helicase
VCRVSQKRVQIRDQEDQDVKLQERATGISDYLPQVSQTYLRYLRLTRLYPLSLFKQLPEETEPEIKRCNLSSVLLLLKASGINEVTKFDFMDKPSRSALVGALSQLHALGALSDTGDLTPLGRKMASFPIDPTFAKVLIASVEYKCTVEAITIVAMMSVDPVFFAPQDKRDEAAAAKRKFVNFDGDHLTLLNLFNAYDKTDPRWCGDNFVNARSMKQICDIREQLVQFCTQLNMPLTSTKDHEAILKCFLHGFFKNVAVRQVDGSYQSLTRQQVWIHPSSTLFNSKCELVMFGEWVETSRAYLRNCSRVQPTWVSEAAPHYYKRNSLNKY